MALTCETIDDLGDNIIQLLKQSFRIFIYGTLKRGVPLFEKGLVGARYLGDVETIEPYPLHIAGSFYGRVMLNRPGRDCVFLASCSTSTRIRFKFSMNWKTSTTNLAFAVATVGGGVSSTAIGYMKKEKWLDPLHSGYLSDYKDRRFVPPWER